MLNIVLLSLYSSSRIGGKHDFSTSHSIIFRKYFSLVQNGGINIIFRARRHCCVILRTFSLYRKAFFRFESLRIIYSRSRIFSCCRVEHRAWFTLLILQYFYLSPWCEMDHLLIFNLFRVISIRRRIAILDSKSGSFGNSKNRSPLDNLRWQVIESNVLRVIIGTGAKTIRLAKWKKKFGSRLIADISTFYLSFIRRFHDKVVYYKTAFNFILWFITILNK